MTKAFPQGGEGEELSSGGSRGAPWRSVIKRSHWSIADWEALALFSITPVISQRYIGILYPITPVIHYQMKSQFINKKGKLFFNYDKSEIYLVPVKLLVTRLKFS